MIWNNNQRIDNFLQRFNTLFCLTHAFAALKLEGFGHNTHGQNAKLTRRLRNNGGRPGACPAAHARSDKAHMRTGQLVYDLFDAFFSRRSPNGGFGPSAKTFGDFQAHLDFHRRFRLLQSLRVGICNHKFNALKLFFNHIVDSITACTANTEDRDPGFQVVLLGHG